MEIHIFSDDKRLPRLFGNIPRARFHPLKELAALVPAVRTNAFFYIDLAGLTKSRLSVFRRAVDANPVISYGYIDAAGAEKDPALLFLAGARDYLGPALCAKPLAAARVRLATAASGSGTAAAPKNPEAAEEKETLSTAARARDWTSITPGEEYVFRMLYIELDGHKDMNVRVAENALGRLLDYFQERVAQFIAPGAGKLWIWNDFSGIALFPFKEKTDEIVAACVRLMLSRRLISVDQNIQKLLFSYRLVLMSGSTIFRERGKTGRIISDAVNSLSHIGTKFAKPGNCYISREIHEDLSVNLKKCFTPAGTFERVPLLRFKLPAKY
jgi:hypothetical protein